MLLQELRDESGARRDRSLVEHERVTRRVDVIMDSLHTLTQVQSGKCSFVLSMQPPPQLFLLAQTDIFLPIKRAVGTSISFWPNLASTSVNYYNITHIYIFKVLMLSVSENYVDESYYYKDNSGVLHSIIYGKYNKGMCVRSYDNPFMISGEY